MNAVTVRPVEGRLVLMPDRNFEPVPAEGVRVYLDSFYARAINQGDLVVVSDKPQPQKKLSAPEESSK